MLFHQNLREKCKFGYLNTILEKFNISKSDVTTRFSQAILWLVLAPGKGVLCLKYTSTK